ncbi:2-dehydro-3-deoxy-6-phosphogalactonate aldolase [Sphingorhabdus sp. Alg231-15]|uniref:2-dehydro-3-deoxy-6-phosphogalactonate aldolase n=1 Tax=Sphingorhabdus sp. Alg231-15 TaxID=1922222 RepID=UPI000D5518F3
MTELIDSFDKQLSAMPVVAILRGVQPDEIEAIGEAIIAAGITILEVPLNSPDPFSSIGIMARCFAGRAIVGAGTVLNAADVTRCKDAGSQLIVSPNMRPDVIKAAVAGGMLSTPGCLTPSEAFDALDAGAHAIKLFPGELVPPAGVKAMRAVLPSEARMLVVGGVTTENLPAYRQAGATGFGIGGSIYRAGDSAAAVSAKAKAFAQLLS